MKVLKKLMALFLCAASLCALIAVPPVSATTVSTFPDVTDPTVGRAVEVLRTMGVIDGANGNFVPQGNLTRAEFCKLSITIMGRGNEVAAYTTKTIFPDVGSKHWARGYVNMAATITLDGSEQGTRLMVGVGNGNFAPDRPITYGEAATVLLRILGYSAAASTNWPSGAVTTAASLGLTANLSGLSASSLITRGQAAILFYNMLSVPVYGSTSTYAETLGEIRTDLLLLACNTTADNGKTGAVKFFTSTGETITRLAAVHTPGAFLQGTLGSALFNKDGQFMTFLPDQNTSSLTITTASATTGATGVLTASDGTRISLTPSTTVWYNGQKQTYNQVYAALNRTGVTVTICYTAAGAVDYLYVGSTIADSADTGAMVAKDRIVGNPFASLTGGATGYTILKNGIQASTSDISQYDVGMFDAGANILYVSDFRLTGVYENAYPNTTAPTLISAFGVEDIPVLPCAIDDLQGFKIGDTFTLLFSADGKVAGAVSPSQARSTAVGVVDADASSGDTITVNLLDAPEQLSTISGKFYGSLSSYLSSLVSVSAGSNGYIGLSTLSGGSSSPLDMGTRTIGGAPLATGLHVYERLNGGQIRAISLNDITVASVPASKIVYRRLNYAGQVDLLLLDDVTGDLYTYGIVKVGTVDGGYGDMAYTNYTTTVTNGSDPSLTTIGGTVYRDGDFIGLAASLDTLDGVPRMAGSVSLKSVKGVSLSNFNLQTGRFFTTTLDLPISDNVQCYNANTRGWFTGDTPMDALNACLAYSNNLTVYYDRNPNEGGKVRIVVAN